jgi:hypothetical protein
MIPRQGRGVRPATCDARARLGDAACGTPSESTAGGASGSQAGRMTLRSGVVRTHSTVATPANDPFGAFCGRSFSAGNASCVRTSSARRGRSRFRSRMPRATCAFDKLHVLAESPLGDLSCRPLRRFDQVACHLPSSAWFRTSRRIFERRRATNDIRSAFRSCTRICRSTRRTKRLTELRRIVCNLDSDKRLSGREGQLRGSE